MQEIDNDTRYLSFDERLQLSIDHLYQEKYNTRVKGLIKRSKFRIQDAHFSSVYYEKRDIDRPTLQQLATCSFINHCRNIIFKALLAQEKPF